MAASKANMTTQGRTKRKTKKPAPQNEAAAMHSRARAKHLDEMLDEALKETFPASDPVAIAPASEPD